MNINSVGSAKNISFGHITDKAYQKIMNMDNKNFTEYNVMFPETIQKDNDFILNYNQKKDRFELISVDYQYSLLIRNPKDRVDKIDFLKFIISKMGAMKVKFENGAIAKRAQKLDLREVSDY